MKAAILVAYAQNKVIGAQGVIPWNLPSERNRFKQICNGKKIIMGRKSFEEIGKALSYCTIIVVSKTLTQVPEGCLLAHSFEEAVNLAGESKTGGDRPLNEEILIAGGGEIYRQALPYCNKIYATEILQEIPGDTCFPDLSDDKWEATVELEKEENGIKYRYLTLLRKV